MNQIILSHLTKYNAFEHPHDNEPDYKPGDFLHGICVIM